MSSAPDQISEVALLELWRHGEAELAAWPLSSAAYRVDAHIGEGTFARVFSGVRQSHFESPTRVALKVLRRYTAGASRELECLLALRMRSHAHIISLCEFFHLRDRQNEMCPNTLLVLVLPQFDFNLSAYLQATPDASRLTQAQHIGAQLSSALAHIHAMGIIHRDLKPDNLLIESGCDRDQPRCLLSDFGQAKFVKVDTVGAVGDATEDHHCPHAFASLYRAPELCFGCSEYTTSPDVWAFGCVFSAVLLSGFHLFDAPEVISRDVQLQAAYSEMEHEQRHLLTLIDSLGTPSFDELAAMNPALAADTERVKSWMRIPPRAACRPWQARLTTELEQRAAVEGLNWRQRTHMAVDLLEAIFVYPPDARPSGDTLASSAFFDRLAGR